jgi:hypothetical protein
MEYILPKLTSAIFVIRSLSYFMSLKPLQMVHVTYFHSIIKHRIVWGSNSTTNSSVFKLQKKIIWIISGAGPKEPCRNLFKKFDILQLPCEYILSVMQFVIDNQNNFFQA